MLAPYLVPGGEEIQKEERGEEYKGGAGGWSGFSTMESSGAIYAISRRRCASDQSSFPTPLAVTEALLPLRRLSGETDRIFP